MPCVGKWRRSMVSRSWTPGTLIRPAMIGLEIEGSWVIYTSGRCRGRCRGHCLAHLHLTAVSESQESQFPVQNKCCLLESAGQKFICFLFLWYRTLR